MFFKCYFSVRMKFSLILLSFPPTFSSSSPTPHPPGNRARQGAVAAFHPHCCPSPWSTGQIWAPRDTGSVCCWQRVAGGQGCRWMARCAQASPRTRTVQPPVSGLPRLGNPGLQSTPPSSLAWTTGCPSGRRLFLLQ